MKRIVSLVLAVSMVFGLFATVFAAGTYSDLTGENAKYAGAVAALSELRVDDQPVINGYPDGTFGPEKTVTRAELAKMLVVCLGLGSEVEALATKTVFSDVPTTHWAAGWINAAAQSKVIVGYPDGSFGPEKTVTYAEAFTMALRALGYGNVADFEGTWPTAYMLKAVELDLTKDMEGVKADVAATRGNIAILLWNMLRTPMWRVTEESENSGMTLSNTNQERMLNVKFPDYTYVEDVYVVEVDVIDNEDVEVSLVDIVKDPDTGADMPGDPFSAKVEGVDLPRLMFGEQVTALVKEGKKGDADTFLTLTPENEIVEGVITKIETDNGKITKITVDGNEYKFDSSDVALRPDADRLSVNDYVVFEANGKKVNTLRFNLGQGAQMRYPVMTTIPYAGAEIVDNVKTAQRAMREDTLVIRNGEWTDREAIEEGDVYTQLKDSDGTVYYAVTDAREEGAFESYATKKIGDDTTHTFVVDGKEYRNVLGKDLLVKEDDKTITLDEKGAPLNAKAKDNKYIDEDVEVVLDFLGLPAALLFEKIDDLANDGSFYAVVHGYWTEPGKKGTDMISLVGFDAEGASADEVSEGVDYKVKDNAGLDASLEKKALLASGDVRFVWAKFDTDEETIKALVPFDEAGLTSGDAEGAYTSKFVVASLAGLSVDNGKVKLADNTIVKLPADVPVMTVTPLEDDDEAVEGFAVEFSEGVKNNTEFVEGSFVAYDGSKRVPKAAYVFVAEEPESTEVFYGLVEDYDKATQNGVGEVKINGVEYEYDADNSAKEPVKDAMVAFTKKSERGKDKEIVKILSVLKASEIDDANYLIVAEKESEDEIIFSGDAADPIDLTDEDLLEEYEDWKVIEIAVETKDDNQTLEFKSVGEVGKGLKAIPNKEGTRVSPFIDVDSDEEVIFIITGLRGDDHVTGGMLEDADAGNGNNETNVPVIGG